MKKYLPIIAGLVLGGLFVMASVMFFLKLGPQPTFPEGSPIAHYMAAFGPTGLMHFVKVFELLGGKICMPKTAVPGMGFFAVCQDTEGNAFALWQRVEAAK